VQKTFALCLTVFVWALLVCTAEGQIIRYPTPTRSPTATPSPSPTATPRIPCPTLNVQVQSQQPVPDGQPVIFVANLGGGDPRVVPTIIWNVSAGSIRDGQGTRRIQVDSTGSGSTSDRMIAADIWIGGYAPECVLQASGRVRVIPPAVKFGDFGELPPEPFKKNMEALAAFLAQTNDNLYVIAYAGRKSERGFAFNWIRKIREELNAAGVSARRVSAVDGGFREEPLFDFWIVPPGSQPPRPTPTVNRNEIVYPPATPARKPGG